MFFLVPPVSVAASPQTSSQGLGLSQSAGAVSLQQAFSELRQNQSQFDTGPSTAPAAFQSTHLLLHPGLTNVPLHFTMANGTCVDPIAGLVPSLKKQGQSLDVSVPAVPPSATSSVPPVCLSPPCTSSPPPTVANQPIPQTQGVTQVDFQVQGQVQGQAQILAQPPTQSQSQTAVVSTTTGVPASSIPPTQLMSPPVVQSAPFVSSPPSSATFIPADVVSDNGSGSPTSTSAAPTLSTTVTPTTAISSPQLAPSASSQPTLSSPSAGLQPVTTSVASVQPTLVHSQPQTATLPGQTHTHCGECDARLDLIMLLFFTINSG